MKKAEIIAEVQKHPYLDFSKHKDLLALVVCSDFFCGPDEQSDFEEVVFAVEKDWLVNYLNCEHVDWNEENVRCWLQEEYTSYDSFQIYEAALKDNAIVMIDFN